MGPSAEQLCHWDAQLDVTSRKQHLWISGAPRSPRAQRCHPAGFRGQAEATFQSLKGQRAVWWGFTGSSDQHSISRSLQNKFNIPENLIAPRTTKAWRCGGDRKVLQGEKFMAFLNTIKGALMGHPALLSSWSLGPQGPFKLCIPQQTYPEAFC